MLVLSNVKRFHAFGWHLLISLCIASALASVVFFVWYPQALAYASGVGEIFILLVGVDVVLGPAITLIIFNPLKKELKRDLGVVVAVQLMALLYGMYTVFLARPVYLVFNLDRFDVVYASDIAEEDLLAAGLESSWSLPMLGPDLVAAKLPSDSVLAKKIVLKAITTGEDIQYKPQYYVPYESLSQVVRVQMKSIENLRKVNSAHLDNVEAVVADYEGGKLAYMPVVARAHNVIALVDGMSAEVLSIDNLRP